MSPLLRRGLIAGALIGCYALLGFQLAPWWVERTLVSTLDERLHLETRIGALRLNPFTLSLQADAVEITEADEQPLVAFERLFVNFELSSLLHWAWSFDEIHLIRPRIRFERLTETQTNFGNLAARWAATGAAPATRAENDAPAGVPRLVIADLRIVAGHAAITDLVPAERFSTDLSPIDLALTDFTTFPEDNGEQRVTISTESGASIAWTGSLSVNPLAVTGRVTLEGTYTPMLFRYFRDQLALPVSFTGGALMATLNYQIEMNDAGEISVRIDDLTGALSGLNIQQQDQPNLAEIGTLTLTGGHLAWPERVVHADGITFDQVLIQAFRYPDGGYFPPSPDQPGDPAADPRDRQAPDADDARLALSLGELELSNWRLIHTDTGPPDRTVEVSELGLTISSISNAPGREMPLTFRADLQPGGSLALHGNLQLLPELRFAADVEGSDLALAAMQPYLDTLARIGITDGHIGLSGSIVSNADEPFRYTGDFHLRDLALIDRVQEESLLSWEHLGVDRVNLTPAALELSLLTLDAPYARIEIERDGSTNIARTLLNASAAPTPASNATDPDATPFALLVGETRISRGTARFSDLALPLPFEANISELNGSLSTLATTSREPVRVALEGQVNEFGRLQVQGDISAFQPTAATDISINFENVNLPSMTPYTVKFAGRKIADGRMDLTLAYQMADGTMNGDNRLLVRDLKLGEKVVQEGAMDLPLDMALALLKDPRGVVDFSFPVSGTPDDPSFSYSGAVAKAFSNVILGLATAPFRLLGSLVGLKASDVDSIGFEPGRADLTPPQKEVLLKLTGALEQRPQLVLELAPVFSTDADRAAMAVARVDAAVQRRLAEQGNGPTLITEQRRQVLEALYDEAGLQPARADLAQLHQQEDEAGKRTLDTPAYTEELRQALIAAEPVPDLDISLLAQSRLASLRNAFTELASLPEQRLRALPATAVELSDKGLVQMSLKVTTMD